MTNPRDAQTARHWRTNMGDLTDMMNAQMDDDRPEELARLLAGTTPGPWRVKAPHPLNACAYVGKQDGYVEVATCYGGDDDTPQPKDGESWGDQPIRDANARLIALAPTIAAELLDALTRIATLQAQVDGLREGLETSKKYRDAYQECDRIATARVRELEEREGAAAAAAWIDGRDAAGATFGAHAMLISNVQPPTAPSAALAKRMDEEWNAAIEAAAGVCADISHEKAVLALKRSGKEERS